jgi:hypothetical protein
MLRKKYATNMPRIGLLPSCLALALAVGSNELTAAEAAHRTVPPAGVDLVGPSYGGRGALRLSDHERLALLARAQALPHTPPAAPAASIPVTNCDDSGPGSYRDAVTNAVSGDTIDLTATPCSVITLTTGDVITGANDLTLQGPGALFLTISGGYIYRPLEHIGFGILNVNDLSISDGHKYLADGATGNPNGGCIYSAGVANLSYSLVKYCSAASADTTRGTHGGGVFGQNGVVLVGTTILGNTATASANVSYGGGVYTPGYLDVINSIITNNYTYSTTSFAEGGGAMVGCFYHGGGPATIKYSSIESNQAIHDGEGGGLYLTGDVDIQNTTISGNIATYAAGGVILKGGSQITQPWSIVNTTIANNGPTARIGGLILGNNSSVVSNSTIAFNVTQNSELLGAGLQIENPVNSDLESTLIAGNITDQGGILTPDDVGGTAGATLSGANNLIFSSSSLAVPAGTLFGVDPLLGILSDNGGKTATIPISPQSPAVDAGNNNAGLSDDQRGSGFPRIVGAAPDIGAFEVNTADEIFADGFD